MSSAAELVMVTKPRADGVEMLDHGRIRQTFDVVNCPGITVVWEGFSIGDDEFETLSQSYHLSNGAVFDNPDEALLAWDTAQNDHEIVEGLGEAMLRHRHGLIRPLWSERGPAQKQYWITHARSFRRMLNSIGFDVIRVEKADDRAG